jgi:integrase
MIMEGKNCFYIYVNIENKILKLESSDKWSKWLILNQRSSLSTVKTYVLSLERFWLWTLINSTLPNEDIEEYLARYREALSYGFNYELTNKNEISNTYVSIPFCYSSPKVSATINKELTAIESFLEYINTKNMTLFSVFSQKINNSFISHQEKNSRGDGYGLKMGIISKEVWGARKKKLKPIKNNSYNDYRAFPFELFMQLLEMAKPREKLIYLLCGGASARIGQALNFTFYDIDYDNKRVWLCDPTSDYQCGLIKKSRKKWLKDKYNIDCYKDKPHNLFGFKYPIPYNPKANRPLYWIDTAIRDIFFETLLEYNPIAEYLRIQKHPFAFVTKNGNRLYARSVDITFKSHCKKLQARNKGYDLSGLGLHSLRHMYGVYMAELYSMAIEGKIDIPPDQIKIYCQHGMGHKSMSSTDIYFNMRFEKEVQIGVQKIQEYISSKKIALSFLNES